MKNFSKESMLLGIGIGMILTAIINFSFHSRTLETEGIPEENQFITWNREEVHEIVEENYTEDIAIETNQEELRNNTEDVVIFIDRGMDSTKIARLLEERQIIPSSAEFLEKADEMQVTDKMRFGEKSIPRNSTLEHIINILIESH